MLDEPRHKFTDELDFIFTHGEWIIWFSSLDLCLLKMLRIREGIQNAPPSNLNSFLPPTPTPSFRRAPGISYTETAKKKRFWPFLSDFMIHQLRQPCLAAITEFFPPQIWWDPISYVKVSAIKNEEDSEPAAEF